MTTTLENIYKYRSYISELYSQDTTLEGDLINSIYENTDDKIEKIEIKIDQYYIGITLKPEHNSIENFNIIINKITPVIQEFILNNINYKNIPLEEKEEFEKYVQDGNLLFEHFIIANLLRISL